MIDFLISEIEETSLFLRDLTRAEFWTYCHIHNAGYIYQNRYEISQSHISTNTYVPMFRLVRKRKVRCQGKEGVEWKETSPPSLSDPWGILGVADAPVRLWVSRRRGEFSVVRESVAHWVGRQHG